MGSLFCWFPNMWGTCCKSQGTFCYCLAVWLYFILLWGGVSLTLNLPLPSFAGERDQP